MRKRTLHTISAAPPSIHNAFEQFQKQNEVKNLSPETIKFYSAKAKTFFLFLEDVEQRIDTITEEDVEDYILYFKEKGTVSDTTINTNLRMVRAFLYWCMERGYMERFPIRMIRADDTIKEPYTADELERLLKAPDKSTCSFAEYRNWVIVNFLLGTGCRASTLINLRIGDVDLSASTVLFQHMKTRNQIVAPLTRRLGRLLEEYLDYRNPSVKNEKDFYHSVVYAYLVDKIIKKDPYTLEEYNAHFSKDKKYRINNYAFIFWYRDYLREKADPGCLERERQKEEEDLQKSIELHAAIAKMDAERHPHVECPYCHSTNTEKISTMSRAVSVSLVGAASGKIGKQWHCKNCGSNF